MKKNLETALLEWRQQLGDQYVNVSQVSLEKSATATYSRSEKLLASLHPHTADQVQTCIEIANRYKTPLYPISSGKNWGYGSGAPVIGPCVLLHLGRLNHIVDYNAKLGYVTVEPGVTQGQLSDFLHAEGDRYWMDTTGSSRDCSIIGNTVERGFGHTPYGDHFNQSCALEIVLPNGEWLRTGFGRYANSQATNIFRCGFGPYIDGLFTQSNLGVVTKMTVWLMPKPDCFQSYFFSIKDDSHLVSLINALRPLRMDRTIKSAVHIGNGYRILSSIIQYPWEEMAGKTPLLPKTMAIFAKRYNFQSWNGSGALYGSSIKHTRRRLKKCLKGKVSTLQFLDNNVLTLAEMVKKYTPFIMPADVRNKLGLVRPIFDMMRGIPTNKIIGCTYWRKKKPVPNDMDPDRDQCGLIWCAPIAPISGEHARKIVDITYDTLLSAGFEPGITFTLLSERSLNGVISITYDREIEGEDERALACHDLLLARLAKKGYYPYRLGIHAMNQLPSDDGHYERFMSKLKVVIDPNDILSPGRYIRSFPNDI